VSAANGISAATFHARNACFGSPLENGDDPLRTKNGRSIVDVDSSGHSHGTPPRAAQRHDDSTAPGHCRHAPAMKIAQVAPLVESVPPRLYGGTERIVSYLTEELVELGHDVTLFASGDSRTRARLRAGSPRALRFDRTVRDPVAYHVAMLEQVIQAAPHFDVIHFHGDWAHLPAFRRQTVPCVTTLHGRLDLPELQPLFAEFSDVPVISISNYQRRPIPWANWIATIPHGLPQQLLAAPPDGRRDGYLAFLGRIAPEKRPDRAIELAVKSGRPLKIAAKVDRVDEEYFVTTIKPLLNQPGIEFIGEIAESDKSEFLGRAAALLLPGDWPEPFGLVMIEAFACGTPVLAYRHGSVPEVVEEGVTGFIVDDEAGALAAIERLGRLDAGRIRDEFERRFTSRRMAEDYLAIYRLLSQPPVSSLETV
jgi:glycosyltransferase involved in cell wall biosynthesis